MDPDIAQNSTDPVGSATSLVLATASSILYNATSTFLADLPAASNLVNGTSPSVLEPGDPLESGNYVLVRLFCILRTCIRRRPLSAGAEQRDTAG
jgi:hypothetical protein